MAAKWAQKTVVIPAQRRGCHLITPKVLREIEGDLSGFKCGLAHLFLQHTSASLTINENYDSDVQADTETFLNKIVPEVSALIFFLVLLQSVITYVLLHYVLIIVRAALLLGSILWKDRMTCQHILNHQCLVVLWRMCLLPSFFSHFISLLLFLKIIISCILALNFSRIPITDGHLNLGTWQGIWLCEHRDHASARKIVVTLNGI
ncbi:UPF0047 protein YjbQ isoform X1 [Triticum aestivum]|uniref:UPF0047 protein YjbQ isoform X1 n=1 Tax=Triticum aestivum TaxID=4565 RepID=UPI001D003EB7|nr:UPF0047 protein YjbQ-like isoform X1 [Triticum aestivum]